MLIMLHYTQTAQTVVQNRKFIRDEQRKSSTENFEYHGEKNQRQNAPRTIVRQITKNRAL
jgi:hypothetical protein